MASGMCGALSSGPSEKQCGEDGNGSINWVGPLIIFLGLVLTGVGNCFYWMFGVSYLDNNSKHEKSPMMLGITYTFR